MLSPNDDFKAQMTEARRVQILMGAAEIFSEKGFHKATTKEIAKAADVSEGTIYNYFDNKRDLLLAMLELMSSQTLQAVVQAHAADNPKDFLTAVLRDRFELIHRHGRFIAPILAEVFADAELREAVYQRIGMPVIAHLEAYFQMKSGAGEFRPINPVLVSRALMGAMMLNSALKLTHLDLRYEQMSPEAMIEEIVTLFVDGLLADGQ